MEEVWEDIAGFEGLYKISNRGRVLRLSKTTSNRRYLPNKVRKPVKSSNGYLKIGLTYDKKQVTLLIHRLVAMTFIDNPKNKKEVNHIDGNKENNIVSNLEWNTPLENTKHSNKNGLVNIKGINNIRAKLTESDVFAIRRLLIKGFNSREISELFNVTRSSIYNIKLKKTWKHI